MNPSPKVITGPLHPDNKGACDWGYQGFLAYGCHGYIVVVDMKTLQIVQTVGPQKGNITHVKWIREMYHHAFATGSTYSLILASADTTGSLYVWDIITGQIRTEFSGIQYGKQVLSIEWYTGHDASHDLLLVLYAPGVIEMWDAYSGINLWRKSLGEASRSLTIDPFDIERIVVLCDTPKLLVLSDITPTKEPSDNITYIQFTDPNPASGSRRKMSSSTDRLLLRTSQSWSKMASIATNILSGPEPVNKRSSLSDDDCELVTSCLQAVFNRAHHHFLILLFPTELQILDIDIELVLSVIRLDKSSPSFVKVIPCKNVDMMLCLHENGSASVRVRRQTEKKQGSDHGSIVAMDTIFDLRCQSDALRLLRHSKVFGFVYHQVTEKQACILMSDSRVIVLDIMKTEYDKNSINDERILPCSTLGDMVSGKTVTNRRDGNSGEVTLMFLTTGLVAGLTSPITMAAMAPSAADKHEAGTVVAVGSGSGTIQLVNVYSGQVLKEYKIFMSPVRYLEWLDSCRILTYSYPDTPNYGSKMVKNEVVLLNTMSGSVTVLRERKDKEGPILLLKSSPSRKYFALVIPDKPLEFWGIDSRQLIREVPLHINSRPCELTWYPHYTVISKEVDSGNKDNGEVKKKRVVCEQLFLLAQTDYGNIIKFSVLDGYMSEVKYFDNKVIYVQGKTDFILMAYKQHYCVVADRGGPLYFADGINGKDTTKFCDNRGSPAVKVQFSPGKDNLHFFVLYTDTLDIYNVVDKMVELEASSPSMECKIKDVSWTGPESVVIVTETRLHMMTVRRKKPSSPTTEDGFFHVSEAALTSIPSNMLSWKLPEIFCPAFLEPKTAFLLKYSLQCNMEPYNPKISSTVSQLDRAMQNFLYDSSTSTADTCYLVARLFGDEFDMNFWQLFKYKSVHGKPDGVNLTSRATQSLDLSQWLSSTVLANKEAPNLIDLSNDNDLDPKGQSEVSDMDISWLNSMGGTPVEDTGLDILMNASDYKAAELSRLALCNKRGYDYRVKQLCTSRWIQVDQVDMAVQGLMETDIDNANFRSDYLKACLSSCIDTQTTSVSVVKLAATHLIAGGHIADGVELLCLINKRLDACKYLIAAGEWKNAVWLAKTSLPHTECLYVICKWAEHLWHNSFQKDKAVLLMLSMDQYTTVLRMLCDLRQYDLAAMFLQACQQQGLLPSSEYSNCVFAEFGKLLAITEYQSAAKHYCQLAGDTALLADMLKVSTHNN